MKLKIQINKNYKSYRIIIGICVLLYIIKEVLIRTTNDSNSVLIFLGADYKTFTLGFYELFRLITSAFLHGSFLHLLCNMYSLFILGNFLEYLYGTKKFLLFLFLGILFGSLTCGILSDNTIMIGMSGGLYCLMTIMILDLIMFRRINIISFSSTILLNLLINFMPNVAWQAHLGGAFIGLILYFAEYYNRLEDKNRYVLLYITIALCACLLLVKYVSTRKDIKKYLGTDMQYVSFLENDIHFKNLSNHYSDKIYEYYLEDK